MMAITRLVWVRVITLCLIILYTFTGTSHGNEATPLDVHAYLLPNISHIAITWRTGIQCISVVHYGEDKTNLSIAKHGNHHLIAGSNKQFQHMVLLKDLKSSTIYHFLLDCNSTRSETGQFSTVRSGTDWPAKLLLLSDPLVIMDSAVRHSINNEFHSNPFQTLLVVGDNKGKSDSKKTVAEMTASRSPSDSSEFLPQVIQKDLLSQLRENAENKEPLLPAGHGNFTQDFKFGNVRFISFQRPWIQNDSQMHYHIRELLHIDIDRSLEKRSWVIAYVENLVNCSSEGKNDAVTALTNGLQETDTMADIIILLDNCENLCHHDCVYHPLTVCISPLRRVVNVTGTTQTTADNWTTFAVSPFLSRSFSRIQVLNASHIHWEEISNGNGSLLKDIWIVSNQRYSKDVQNISAQIIIDKQIITTESEMQSYNSESDIMTMQFNKSSSVTHVLMNEENNDTLTWLPTRPTATLPSPRSGIFTSSTLKPATSHFDYTDKASLRNNRYNLSKLRTMTKTVIELIKTKKMETSSTRATTRQHPLIVLPNDRMVVQILSGHGAPPNIPAVSRTTAVALLILLSVLFILAAVCIWRRCKKSRRHTFRYREEYVNFYQPLANPKSEPDYDSTFTGVSIPLLQEATKV